MSRAPAGDPTSEQPLPARQDRDQKRDRDRWNERYRRRAAEDPEAGTEPPSPLVRMASVLPRSGSAVDLAGGDGGGALFLAERGLDTTLVDVADVALERAAHRAQLRDLTLRLERIDLTGLRLGQVQAILGSSSPDLVTCFAHLQRQLLASVAEDLPPRSLFVAAIATTTNLTRHPRPPARFLLEPGELADLVIGGSPDLQVLHRREGWADDRHRAEIAVRRR